MDVWLTLSGMLAIMLIAVLAVAWRWRKDAQIAVRERAIRSLVFSDSVFEKLREKHPQLTIKDCQLVARALREFFLVYLRSNGFVGMPSRVVDDLWHEFILHTRDYARFCQDAFGGYFHHIPAGAKRPGATGADALRVTWRYACLSENIDPRKPTRLPLLFAIDNKLDIANGFHYSINVMKTKRSGTTGCGGSSGCGGGGSVSGDGFACTGSSDGGGSSGCGGGCGGGGGD